RDRVAVASEKVEVVPARVAPLEGGGPEGGGARTLGDRMDVDERTPAQILARVPKQALGDVIRVQQGGLRRVDHQDAGGSPVDGALVARFLLEQLLAVGGLLLAKIVLARLHEEIRDVKRPLAKLLVEKLAELRSPFGGVCELAP